MLTTRARTKIARGAAMAYFKGETQGFITGRATENGWLETLYACQGGRMYKSEEARTRSTFTADSWERVAQIPPHAEYIGNYPRIPV